MNKKKKLINLSKDALNIKNLGNHTTMKITEKYEE